MSSPSRLALITGIAITLMYPLRGACDQPAPAQRPQMTAAEMIAALSKLPPGTPVEFESTTTTTDGGSRKVTEQAAADGASGKATGDAAANFKLANTQPPTATTSQGGASGGDSDGEGSAKGGDRAALIARVLCALGGLLGIGYAVWLLQRKAAIKDAAIAGAAGAALIAAAIEPAILIWSLAAAVGLLLLRFGPAALQARAYEPSRAIIGGIGVLEDQAAKMPDTLGPVSFPTQRAFYLAALALVKAEIAKQQTGNDRAVTSDLKRADGLP